MRALYRFQLCCNLFGQGRHGTPGRPRLSFRSVDVLDKFICIFEPWQIEEIACIHAFAEKMYDQVFRDIAWDVDENSPKFDGQRPPTPDGTFDLGNSCQFCLASPYPVNITQQKNTRYFCMTDCGSECRGQKLFPQGIIFSRSRAVASAILQIRDCTHLVT